MATKAKLGTGDCSNQAYREGQLEQRERDV